MNKAVNFMATGLCVSSLLLCGCSSKDKDDGENKEIKVAVKMFDNWSHARIDVGTGSKRHREPTPEEAMGLEKPEELSSAVYTWVKNTEFGEYYRMSRENLATIYKKMIDDYKVRKGSGVGQTEYSNELMREWRSAHRADYALRNFIVQCYSRKELSPLPQDLMRIFAPDKNVEDKVAAVKANVQRLSSELSALKSELESVGAIAWSQKKSLDEWRVLQGTLERLCSRIDRVDSSSRMLGEETVPDASTDKAKYLVREARNGIAELKETSSRLLRTASGKRMIVDGQVILTQCADERAVLESELANIKSEVAAAGTATWADEKSIASWNELHGLMSGLASRADQAKSSAYALVQKIRPVVRIGKGDAVVAAFGERAEALYSSLSEMANLALEQRTIAEGKAQLVKQSATYSKLEKELVDLKATLDAMEPVSWSDEKEIKAWQVLHNPALELAAKAGEAGTAAAALAESVKPIVLSSKGDKTVAAFGAKVEQLNASLSTVAKQSSERLEIVKGQVPLTTFAKNCKAIADGLTKIPAAFEKKTARMAEIESIERQVRSSRTRDYSDLDDLARRAAEVKARSVAERKDEIALGQRVQGLIRTIEDVMGSNAMHRFKVQVQEKAAHERMMEMLNAFKRTIGVSADSAFPGYIATMESKSYQLADMKREDDMLNNLDEILRVVRRLAASQR